MSFSRIVGQPRAAQCLRADLKCGRVAETYLFTGLDADAQRALALELAKALNCEQLDLIGGRVDACDACNSCRKVDEGNHPDVFVLDFDSQGEFLNLKDEDRAKQKELRIEAVRELIGRSVLSPLEGRKKVFVVDGAEHLSDESANALLKVLEESSRNAHWILLASSAERVIPTIRSRARRIGFAPAPAADPESGRDLDLTAQKILEAFVERTQPSDGPLDVSAAFFADKKKGNARKRAEELLMALCQRLSENLRKRPSPERAELLTAVFQAQDDLRRNVAPQLVVDELLVSLWSRPR